MGRRKGGVSPNAPRFPCPSVGCTKSFGRRDHLQRHTANHEPHRHRYCPECGKVFARQDVLTAHLRKHEEEEEQPDDAEEATEAEPTHSPSPDVEAPPVELPPLLPTDPFQLFSPTGAELDPQNVDELYAWVFSGAIDTMGDGMDWNWATEPFAPSLGLDQDKELDLVIGPLATDTTQFDFTVNSPTRAPVAPAVRETLLTYLATVPALATSPYFTCEALSLALDLFWTFFSPQVPIVHQPTFDINSCSTGLLASMVTIGLCFSPPSSEGEALFEVASSISRHLRSLVLLWETQTHPVALPTLHALCLLGVAGQQLLDRGQHMFSVAFSAFELSLGRSMDIFSYRFFQSPKGAGLVDPDLRWRAWIELESFRRIVFLILMRDTQLSSMYRNLPTRALSIFLVRVGLPADEAAWQATSALEWAHLPPSTHFTLPQALKESFSSPVAGATRITSSLSAYSQLCVLHGLMATAWDLRWRGPLRSASVETAAKNWRQLLELAYDQHRHRIATALDLPSTSASSRALHLAASDILLAADLELRGDKVAIQTFAGAQDLGGRPISSEDYAVASKTLRRWATTSEARTAAALAASYLRLRLMESDLLLNPTLPVACAGIYSPFSLYLAAITIWVCTSVQPSFVELERNPNAGAHEPHPVPLDLSTILTSLSSPLSPTYPTPAQLSLLLASVLGVLERSRWGLAKEYCNVLRRIAGRPRG